MIDYTKLVRTKDGRAVEIKFTDGRGKRPIVGYVEGDKYILQWGRDGRFNETDSPCDLDLENVPEPIVTWLVHSKEGAWSAVLSGEFGAKRWFQDPRYTVLLKLTYTPGNGATVEVVEERK